MKKIVSVIVVTLSLASLSAYASPPLTDGSWIGTYSASNTSTTCSGSGTAVLTQKSASVDPATGDTKFTGTLTLENFVNPDHSSPAYDKGVVANTRISPQSGNSVYINENQAVCDEVWGVGMYDDSIQTIYRLTNSQQSCSCYIMIQNLTYKPSASK